MLILEIIGLQTLIFLFISLICCWLNYKWRNAVAKRREIERLVDIVAKESAMFEFESVHDCSSVPKLNQCAVCFCPTTTRCSQCKSVHYCSGKCQIIHWRQGHKDECQLLTTAMHSKQESEFSERTSGNQSEMHVEGSELLANVSVNRKLGHIGRGSTEEQSKDDTADMASDRATSEEMQEVKLPPPKSAKSAACANSVSGASKMNKLSSSADEMGGYNPQLPNGKIVSDVARPAKLIHKKSIRKAASSEMLMTDASVSKISSSLNSSKLDSVNDNREDDSRLMKCKEARSLSFNASGDHTRDASNGLKISVWKKVQQLRSKQSHNYEILFPYELFVKLYSSDEELSPFGLRNCGNSCYANTVIQCLAFTRPLTSFFARGLHSKSCRKKGWCFNCEFQHLILKAREGESPLSPIRILSKIQKIGSHLGHGREEDAHEFLRYAVDTMQYSFLKEAGSVGSLSEETTLVGLTFGGYLQSKIKCMRCLGKSEIFERIMDLTVEIDGNIESLEQALAQFTSDEMLDGENKYNCNRCKSYVKAKKRLTILEAPNILTIVLKRFQSCNFGKLNKSIRFPEILNMAPYMCGRSDKSPQYGLYAVVVHRDAMGDASTGHYVCYIKTTHGRWFGVNDDVVMPVELERVLLEEAYMLLYARHSPRAPAVQKSEVQAHGMKLKKRILEAVPSNHISSKATSSSHFSSNGTSKAHLKHEKYPYWMDADDSTSNELHGPDGWRFHPVDSSSESSSLFSWSDASSCSTASTKDSVKSEDFSDFLFGETWHGHRGF